MAKPSQVES